VHIPPAAARGAQKPLSHCAALPQWLPSFPSVHAMSAPPAGAHRWLTQSASVLHGSFGAPFVHKDLPNPSPQKPLVQSLGEAHGSPTAPVVQSPVSPLVWAQ
jgi:hypothetical protein